MRNIFLLTAIILLFAGCVRQQAVEDKSESLKAAMQNYLYEKINYDSSKAKFDVLDVTYFEDKEFYECEFKVHLKNPQTDTTGIMTARIGKDFKKVIRKL